MTATKTKGNPSLKDLQELHRLYQKHDMINGRKIEDDTAQYCRCGAMFKWLNKAGETMEFCQDTSGIWLKRFYNVLPRRYKPRFMAFLRRKRWLADEMHAAVWLYGAKWKEHLDPDHVDANEIREYLIWHGE